MTNSFEEMQQEINEKIKQNPTDASLLLERAWQFFAASRYDKCITDCSKIIAIDTKNCEAYSLSAYSSYRKKEYRKAEETVAIAQNINDKFYLNYLVLGNIYVEYHQDYENAKLYYERALELNPESILVYNAIGIMYETNYGDWTRALEYYDKGISLKPNTLEEANIYNSRGLLLERIYNKPEYALEDYKNAININPFNARFYNNIGVLYKNKYHNYDKALDYYTKAINQNVTYSRAYNNRGNLYSEYFNDYRKALKDFKDAENYAKKRKQYSLLKQIEGNIEKTEAILSKSDDENKKAKNLMDKINDSGLNNIIKSTKKSFANFIQENKSLSNNTDMEFIVLRRWNSYTPIIGDANRISKGGGYFFRINNCGIVIDPGFNFIDNFKSQGLNFSEIDHIVITHAHNDHTTDLESVITLLHQYNENIRGDFDDPNPENKTIMSEVLNEQSTPVTEDDRKRIEEIVSERLEKSPRRKRLRLYMSTSTYKKYATILDLYSKSDYDVILIKDNDELPIVYPNEITGNKFSPIEIQAIYAKHNDLLSDRDSLGFIIKYDDFILIYTGDTGFNEKIKEQYEIIKEKYKNKKIVLLAHLGGFKEYEEKYDYSKSSKENQKFFYKNHLGRLGLAKLVETLEPYICIISEFGEEFRTSRQKITKIFQDVYNETYFIPADIGLCFNSENKIKLIDKVDDDNHTLSYNFYDIHDTSIYECYGDASLHYYNAQKVNEGHVAEGIINNYRKKNFN